MNLSIEIKAGKEKLDELLSYGYRRHYFKPKYIITQIKNTKSIKDFTNKANTAVNLIRRNLIGRHY